MPEQSYRPLPPRPQPSYKPLPPQGMGALWEQYQRLLQAQGMLPMQLPMQTPSQPSYKPLPPQPDPRMSSSPPIGIGAAIAARAQHYGNKVPGVERGLFAEGVGALGQAFGPSGGPGAPTAPGGGQYRPGAEGVESPSSGIPNRAVDYIQRLGSGASIQDAVPLGEGGLPVRNFQMPPDPNAPAAPPVPMPTGDPWGGATSAPGPVTADPTGDPSRYLAGQPQPIQWTDERAMSPNQRMWQQMDPNERMWGQMQKNAPTMAEIDQQLDAAAKAGADKEEKPTQPGDIRDENRAATDRYAATEWGSWLSDMPFAHAANKEQYQPWRAYPTGGAALRYEQEGDQISADERRYFKDLGVDIPMGMTRTQFNRMFGTSLTGGGTDQRYLDIMEEGNRIRALKEQGIGERFAVGEKRRKFSTYNIPTGVKEDMRSLIKAKYKMADAGALRTKFEGQFGPIMSRWNSILSGLGVQDPNYSVVRSKLTQALGSFLTSETGAQRGMTEVRWLETALPRLIDSGANWDAVLKSFQKDLDRDIMFLYDTWGDEGYRVHQWERAMTEAGVQFEPKTPGLTAQGGGLNPKVANAADQSPAPISMTAVPETVEEQGEEVHVIRPDGGRKPFRMTAEEQAEYMKQHPDHRIEKING